MASERQLPRARTPLHPPRFRTARPPWRSLCPLASHRPPFVCSFLLPVRSPRPPPQAPGPGRKHTLRGGGGGREACCAEQGAGPSFPLTPGTAAHAGPARRGEDARPRGLLASQPFGRKATAAGSLSLLSSRPRSPGRRRSSSPASPCPSAFPAGPPPRSILASPLSQRPSYSHLLAPARPLSRFAERKEPEGGEGTPGRPVLGRGAPAEPGFAPGAGRGPHHQLLHLLYFFKLTLLELPFLL